MVLIVEIATTVQFENSKCWKTETVSIGLCTHKIFAECMVIKYFSLACLELYFKQI